MNLQSNVASGGGGGAIITSRGNVRNWSLINWNSGNGGVFPGSFGVVDSTSGLVRQLFDATGDVYLGIKTGDGTIATSSMAILSTGNIGVGTVSPSAKLEIDGVIKLTAGSGTSMVFADGTTQSTAWNGTTLGGDYAESVDVLGDRVEYEPGDVIAIDPASPGKFTKTGVAYSKLVAGVYSTKPGLTGRRATYARPDMANEVPMAMIGIVPVKVTAENGPIELGDLLVSSAALGYAMKGTDRDRMIGATIGKALAPLASGTGLIEVLISLQ